MPIPRSLTSASLTDLDLTLTAGEWPADLSGEVVISSPEPNDDLDYALFGFGALVRISLQPGTHGAAPGAFALRSRVIDSPSKRLYDKRPDAFIPQPFGFTGPLGFPNQVNTAPLPWGDRLFATWDVGRPTEVDANTLDFLGEVGQGTDWGDETIPMGGLLPFYFSSAHPIIDPQRDLMWTVKLVPTPDFDMQIHLVAWNGEGAEVRSWPIEGAIVTGSSHTLSQTRDWLVLADSGNFKTDPGELAGGPRTVLIDEKAPVFFVRKDALLATATGAPYTPTRSTVAPTTGHFYAKWDDSDGIDVIFEHMDLMDLGFRLAAGDLDADGNPIDPAKIGFYNMAMAPNSVSELHFDPLTGTAERRSLLHEEWCFNLQLSAIDWSTEGMSAPVLHHIACQGWRPDGVTKRALDLYRAAGRVGSLPAEETKGALVSLRRDGLEVHDSYTFDNTGDHITSPAFAPRGYGEDSNKSRYAGTEPGGQDGYVVLPILSDDGFRVEVFDAAAVGKGPVAVLSAPGAATLPAMLHSAWMPSVAEAPSHERLAFSDDVDDTQVQSLDGELADAVRLVAGELDDALADR